MKKVISVATTAAMTLSMLSVPAVICAAEEVAAAPVSIFIKDQTIEKGLSTFTVPVSLTQDTALSSAEIKFSTAMYPGGTYVASITGVKSEVEGVEVTEKDGTVTVSGSADVKKGQTVFTLTVKIFDNKGNAATTVPDSANFKLSVDSAKIGSTELSAAAKEEASAYLFVRTAEKTADYSFTIDSVNTTAGAVKVPVRINGTLAALSTRFRVTNGAEITSIEIAEGYDINVSDDGKGLVYAPLNISENMEFKNEVIAYINVKLPEDVVSGQSFEISTKFIDTYTFDDKTLYPETLENSDIIYVKKGDANLDNILKAIDATYMDREVLSQSVSNESMLPELYTGVAENNAEVKATIDNCGMDKLVAAATNACDINGDDLLKAVDASYMKRYILQLSVEGKTESEFTVDDFMASIQ